MSPDSLMETVGGRPMKQEALDASARIENPVLSGRGAWSGSVVRLRQLVDGGDTEVAPVGQEAQSEAVEGCAGVG